MHRVPGRDRGRAAIGRVVGQPQVDARGLPAHGDLVRAPVHVQAQAVAGLLQVVQDFQVVGAAHGPGGGGERVGLDVAPVAGGVVVGEVDGGGGGEGEEGEIRGGRHRKKKKKKK